MIDSLQRPPTDHPMLHAGEKGFERIDQPYSERTDIWLRYGCEEHLVAWARLIVSHLPGCLKQAEAWDAKQGSPS